MRPPPPIHSQGMIVVQIKQREAARAREQELREQEARAMLQRIKDEEVKEVRPPITRIDRINRVA